MKRLRTTLTRAVAAGAATALLAACGNASLGGSGTQISSDGEVKIGLLVPQSGVYKPIGEDLKNGFAFYLDQHHGRFGDHKVKVVLADEGESVDTGTSAAERLIKQDNVLALTGVVNSAVMNSVKGLVESVGVPLVGSNASPPTVDDAAHIWRTSYVGDDAANALGAYIAAHVDGPTYLIAADYQAGHDVVGAFKKALLAAGGKVAGEEYTPFPQTTNYQPFLARIEKSKAKSVFCFYAGGAAIDFVKQYHQFDIDQGHPLFSPGFLTEGGVLQAEGPAAEGVTTAMNYSPDLKNETNAKFVNGYQKEYGVPPTTYAVASYDAAQALDLALQKVNGDLDRESLNKALGAIGDIDSPRGAWHFSAGRTPVQEWYLRRVQVVGGKPTNRVVATLGTLGDS